jgi:hypothetical protein
VRFTGTLLAVAATLSLLTTSTVGASKTETALVSVSFTPESTAATGYINVHQCTYFSSFNGDLLTTLVPTGTNFSAGTNVSNTPDTAPRCGPGNSGYPPYPPLTAVIALDLLAH